jgi:hypothetical protein
MKCGNLNFPELYGPLQACNGTTFTISSSGILIKVDHVLIPRRGKGFFLSSKHPDRLWGLT